MDELDADLHPDLMSEIISWFHDSDRNENGAQLVMTCHNTSILTELQKEEVWLTEKSIMGDTHVMALKDLKTLRRDANLYSKYSAGEFGGIPRFG